MLAALTELGAVNSIMLALGLAPINEFVDGVYDQAIAREELEYAVRHVCSYGFSFNNDEGLTLYPESDNFVLMPTGAIQVDPTDPRQKIEPRCHPTRGWVMWDKANLTYEISEPIKVNVAWGFTFDQLPQIAQAYAIARAGQTFQSRGFGDPTSDRFNDRDVAIAWTALLNHDAAQADRNIFRDSPELAAKTNRARRGWRDVR